MACAECGGEVAKRRLSMGAPGSLFCRNECEDAFADRAVAESLARRRPRANPPVYDGDGALDAFGRLVGVFVDRVAEKVKRSHFFDDEAEGETFEETDAPPPPPKKDDRAELLRKIGLPPTATLAEAEKRFRQLAKKYHPDAGGSVETMQKLNEVMGRLRDLGA